MRARLRLLHIAIYVSLCRDTQADPRDYGNRHEVHLTNLVCRCGDLAMDDAIGRVLPEHRSAAVAAVGHHSARSISNAHLETSLTIVGHLGPGALNRPTSVTSRSSLLADYRSDSKVTGIHRCCNRHRSG